MTDIATILSKNNVFLAPMAGVTDMPFRVICKEQGCGLTYTEMVSAKGLHYGNAARTKSLIAIAQSEKPCAVQLFGSDARIMAEQAKRLCENYAEMLALIDINMGCPAPKITGNGEGSALMKVPALAADIIQSVVKASTVPVTVKFRKGWDDSSVNAVEFACMAQDCGAQMVTIHGRTRMQMYAGKADWDIIAKVKQAVTIPVLGNGDIFSAKDAKQLFEMTNCDGLMVARGAQGNPWIFAQIQTLLREGKQIEPPTINERIDMALRHARDMVAFRGERAIVQMRKHVAWYIKDIYGAAHIRDEVNRCETLAQLETLLYTLKDTLN